MIGLLCKLQVAEGRGTPRVPQREKRQAGAAECLQCHQDERD
jgi:hypothetical protein